MSEEVKFGNLIICGGGGCPQLENAIGCIKAIQRVRNVKFDYAWGTSAGAIAASMLMSYENQDIEKFEKLLRATPISEWFYFCPWQAIKSIFGKSNYVADNTGLKKALLEYVDGSSVVKVRVSVSEMCNGKFVKSELVDGRPSHVLASMSFQHIFPPVRINGVDYGDGGINDNIPLPSYLNIPKYEHIYLILAPSMPLLPNVSKWDFIDRLFNVLDNTMNREIAQIEQLRLDELPNVTILRPDKWVESASFLDWSTCFEQVDASYEFACKKLTEGTSTPFPLIGG